MFLKEKNHCLSENIYEIVIFYLHGYINLALFSTMTFDPLYI